jgi:Fe-S cluster assembly protein SufB
MWGAILMAPTEAIPQADSTEHKQKAEFEKDSHESNLSREILDSANEERLVVKAPPGITEEVVRLISKEKKEPAWMLQKRLKAFEVFKKMAMPTWGPNLDKLNLSKITCYGKSDAEETRNWEDVPDDIKNTFEKLGIPEAERTVLAGVGSQYESTMVYHNLKEEWAKQGVIFENMDVAIEQYPELVKEYFMTKCVPITDHKFAALHAAVWSGGTFIYIPKGVKMKIPLQAYFRMNAQGMGQFEHTLIIVDEDAEVHYIEGCSAPQYSANSLHAGCVEVYVKKGARARYSSVENWSKNTYNLNTKRAVVDQDGIMEWIGGNMGSGVTMLYPCSILKGKRAKADHISIAFAGKGQNQDTGAKVIHLAPETSCTIKAKSISKDGGITTYRGLLQINKGAKDAKALTICDALILDKASVSNTTPHMEINEDRVDIAHEATTGRISEEKLFYLMSRGLSEDEAMKLVVSGFIEPIVKQLPLEYAVELNRLIELEMEGVG